MRRLLKRWLWRLLGRGEDGYPTFRIVNSDRLVNSDRPLKTGEIKIVEPEPAVMQDGLANLEKCLPYWRNMPGLLVMTPSVAVIVSLADVQHDRMGFTLTLSIDERIATPPDYPSAEVTVGCVWNQPYMYMHEACLSAPYGFTLYFGSEGVARVREKAKRMREKHGSNFDELLVVSARHRFKGRMLDD